MPKLPPQIHALAASQRGVATRAQLLAAGVASSTIDGWISRGWLASVHRGVYRLAGATETLGLRRAAGLLAVGPPCALAGPAAARLHGLPGFDHDDRIEVLTRPGRRVRPRGVDVRTSGAFGAGDIVEVAGYACTSGAWTAIDLGAVVREDRLADIVSDALSRQLTTPRELRDTLERIGCVPGVGPARRVIDGMFADDGAYRARTERRGRQLAIEVGLPRGEVNVPAPCCGHPYEMDYFAVLPRRNVEWDGPHHDRPSQRRKDRERDWHLREHLGIEVTRIPAEDVWERPDEVRRILAALR